MRRRASYRCSAARRPALDAFSAKSGEHHETRPVFFDRCLPLVHVLGAAKGRLNRYCARIDSE
jgi:hypothetical protein